QIRSDHPIVLGRNESERIRRIFFFYGEAFRMTQENSNAEFLLAGRGANIDFEGNPPSPMSFPAVGVALDFGHGRMVALGDATIFTSKFDETLREKTGINRPE